MTLDAGKAFCHTLKHHQPYSFAGDLPVKALLTDGQMSMDFNIMTRREQCRAKVRVADRTFTTFGSRGGVIFVLSGAWQLGEKLLRADQGASWENGSHTLRLLETKGTLLFSEITWLPGH
ncbi:HutD-family protein [Enterobacter cancerogenus]|uniref:HutD-family protein n=1 Tax=Enterobacter cancerogenus TaxID=69218 RepID=A0A484Z8V8_9ENTR|nr:HutD-family protein [Enterobacter cancerogenus]